MDELSYNLPAYLISHHRSGSNFIKNVIAKSSRMKCNTIYDPQKIPFKHPEDYLLLKSHAPSYSHLLSELGSFAPTVKGFPHKIVVLWRDPRDIMISYFDWNQDRFGVKIKQDEFIHDMRWGYGAVGLGIMNQLDTFKTFVKNWYVPDRKMRNVLEIKYEDLIQEKNEHFERIFSFLELTCPIYEDAFGELVQQLNSVRDNRGISGGWKIYYNEYRTLIDIVNKELRNEIELLGYET